MNLEKSGDENKRPGKNTESRTERLEKNIEAEKPENYTSRTEQLEDREYYSTREERLAQTPRENGIDSKGIWQGERGESKYIPNDAKAQEALARCGRDGVEYKDAVPDFAPFAKETVEIKDMHANRSETFRKADNKCAQKWNEKNFENKSDWTGKNVSDWRIENGYTWHECNDCKTCQLVPTDIHSKCGHLGGFAECKKKDA